MTEAYTYLDNTTKFYNYGANVPFNFFFITDANKNSSPNDFKKVIEQWMERVPEGQVANWVVSTIKY